MRRQSIAIATIALITGPAAAQDAPESLDNPAYEEPASPWNDLRDAMPTGGMEEETAKKLEELRQRRCNDTITQARAEAGLPMLDRKPATPDEAHHIYAVDRREDGCSVMVMAGNPEDIRPLPAPMTGGGGLIPAKTTQ